MAHLAGPLPLIADILIAFLGSSLLIVGLLAAARIEFPMLLVLQITAFWTLAVLAALRAIGAVRSREDIRHAEENISSTKQSLVSEERRDVPDEKAETQ
ncbi:hypothetical protein C8R43DRAFT_991308 [Mycena crocata]|nr:hypothetical protein C8R43DRAFT_991308 [Mycena crocata]